MIVHNFTAKTDFYFAQYRPTYVSSCSG